MYLELKKENVFFLLILMINMLIDCDLNYKSLDEKKINQSANLHMMIDLILKGLEWDRFIQCVSKEKKWNKAKLDEKKDLP